MSTTGLFIIGVLVTLLVAGAMALLVYAAILDGRDAASRQTHGESAGVPSSASPGVPSSESVVAPSAVNIVQTAQATGRFDTLVTAIHLAGLNDLLEHGGPYTVFAPNDEAFAKLPEGVIDSLLVSPETLANILSYHVVPGRMTAAEVAARSSAPTFQGEDLPVSNNGAVRVDGARVVTGDIQATNGLIHVIDRVLLPARI